MPFNTALSALRAAQSDLKITGNNIANAGTIGFKQSRAEFADVYAASLLGSGSKAIGSGVVLSEVAQMFDQGAVKFTENSLDLAINGDGFFVLREDGATTYTRAGEFGVNSDGYIVANSGGILQGNAANANGVVIGGAPGDLVLSTTNADPRQTSEVDQVFNLDSSEDILAEYGTTGAVSGTEVSVSQVGSVAAPPTNNYVRSDITVNYENGNTRNYTIPLSASTTVNATNIATDMNTIPGVTAAASTSAFLTFPSDADLGNGGGGGATSFFYPTASGQLQLNGRSLSVSATSTTPLADLAVAINNLSAFSASLNTTTTPNQIQVTNTTGADIRFEVSNASSDVAVTVTGARLNTTTGGLEATAVAGQTIVGALNANYAGPGTEVALVGGDVLLTLDDTVAGNNGITDSNGALGTFFGQLGQEEFARKTFDVSDPETYNHSTSTTVYDSQGNAHVMTQYFVKEPESRIGTPRTWSMYVQVDGENVDYNPADTSTTMLAPHLLIFESNGALSASTDDIVITNWTPLGTDGAPNNTAAPSNDQAGIITDPPTTSDFRIDILGTTSYGGSFNVESITQDGYATGQLSSLEIASDGTLFSRFTNGQAQIVGQIVLGKFNNPQGLSPVGNSSWAETVESGAATIADPGTSSLGVIQSGALEESNVDLSAELVNLILAQRNFQASAKTIETVNSITQTIINIR